MKLEKLILQKKAKIAILGLGYVGLPHAIEISKRGFFVYGIDIDKNKINLLKKRKSYIGDVKTEDLKKVLNKKFFPVSSFKVLKDSDIVTICVPTPLDKHKVPDLSYIKSATFEIQKRLKKEMLIVLESTSFPGTTEEVILPILEKKGLKVGKDFYLAFAPERIDPGSSIPLSQIPKVVGGVTKKCTKIASLFYQQFIEKVYPVSSPKVAEMTKLLENTYRLINISAVNELALLCGKMGIDIWEVIEAAKTKPYGFQPFYPSPKIGGHCIPLDPFYLSWKAKEYNFWTRFIELAGEINEMMPHFVVTRVNFALNRLGKSIKNSKILIWGVAYKKDVPDTRESAAHDIIWDLKRKGAKIEYFDPFVKEFEVKNHRLKKPIKLFSIDYKPQILKKYDCVLILTDHSGFDYESLAKKANLVVDTRNAIKSRKHKNVIWL